MCWLCQHIYFMSFSHLRVPPSQFIPYSFSLWIHFPPLQDWEHQLGELTVLTRSVLLVQYLHRIYISYETYQFRYISGTMWIKSVISSKILEVLSPSLSLFMVTKLILACAKYISTLLPCTQQLLTAHCCQSLLLLTALPWGLNTAVEAPGNAELKSTNSQFWSRSLPVFLFSLISAGSHFLNPFTAATSGSTHRDSQPVWKRLDTVTNWWQQIWASCMRTQSRRNSWRCSLVGARSRLPRCANHRPSALCH